MPDGLGIELVGELSSQLNRTHFVMLTIAEDKTFVLDALGAGAVGYLLKGSTDEEIIKGIRQASLGLSPLSGEVARMMVDDIHRKRKPLKALECLTKREAQVLEQAALGLSDKEISTELNITLNTVNSHLKSIYSKLEIHSRAELIASYGIRSL